MSNKLVMSALGTMISIGLNTQPVAQDNHKYLQLASHGEVEKCYGICKAGKNDCGTGQDACAAQASHDNQRDAWIYVIKGTCGKIVGGTTMPPESQVNGLPLASKS